MRYFSINSFEIDVIWSSLYLFEAKIRMMLHNILNKFHWISSNKKVCIEANMKLLKLKMEIKGPISDLNLGGSFLCLLLIHHLIQFDKQFFQYSAGIQHSARFFICLIGNPFESCRNLELKFCIALIKNSCCFPFSQIPSCFILFSLIKSPLPCCFTLAQFP